MHPREATLRFRSLTITGATILAVFGVMGGEAWAACFTPPAMDRRDMSVSRGVAALAKPGAPPNLAAVDVQGANGRRGTVIGLWRSVYTASPGEPDEFPFDEGFQQFHADGSELMVSKGVPPTLGNVCIGVWRLGAGGVVTLRHVTWNWSGQSDFGVSDPYTDAFSNASTGHFQMLVRLTVNSSGTRFSGTWEAVSFDVNGVPVPGTDFSGTVEGERIDVH